MDAVSACIKAMQNYFTLAELQHISESLSYYNRTVESKQQRHTVDKLHQIFSISAQGKKA